MGSRSKLSKEFSKRRVARQKAAPAGPLAAGAWFEKLLALQKRLRAPNGCPWDRQQTHVSLRPYLIEEAYEVLDALESGDDAKFAEEMGDLLLQVVFHSQIATEEKRFTVADVIREVHQKMVRRHPHVFGEKRAKDAEEVLKNWDQIKAQERIQKNPKSTNRKEAKKPASLLDGIARTLPATLEGLQLTKRAARIGFDWENVTDILDKMREESAEVQHALEGGNAAHVEEEIGDLLFAAVNVARFVKVDPEIALRRANAKFQRRFQEMERLASEAGYKLGDVPRADMEKFWESTKRREKAHAIHGAGRAR